MYMYISHIEIFSEVVYFQKFKAFDLYCVNDTNIEYIQVECCFKNDIFLPYYVKKISNILKIILKNMQGFVVLVF